MHRTAVINIVGLAEGLIGPHTPRIAEFRQRGALARVTPAFPAVTCTAQSSYLTGTTASAHGIVGNGWYDRNLAEVQFWKQSNHMVRGKKLWEELRERDPAFTCAKLFWWYNMYSSADYSITPRPIYRADGRKVFDIYCRPYSIGPDIKKDLGEFPFPAFWGPAAGKETPQGRPEAVSRWIGESAKWIERKYQPGLSLVYLPHLDYNLQRYGPFTGTASLKQSSELNPQIVPDLIAIDHIVGGLVDFFAERSVQVILLSEYAITNVNWPIHLNRVFRKEGWLTIKEELGRELLDGGASKVFAVADHQIAHIYLNDSSLADRARKLIEAQPGIHEVLGASEKAALGIDHARAGDLIAVAKENAWFTYYYWMQDELAPDFARTVDIHRKPGYDPVELFLDPSLAFPQAKIAWRLLQKKLGFRMLMDVIPLDATLVKGSHGRRPQRIEDFPVLISPRPELLGNPVIEATDVYHVLKRHVMT
jgi:predicted AlkP superfamily pyrophosphatase or phosphodiesterase